MLGSGIRIHVDENFRIRIQLKFTVFSSTALVTQNQINKIKKLLHFFSMIQDPYPRYNVCGSTSL